MLFPRALGAFSHKEEYTYACVYTVLTTLYIRCNIWRILVNQPKQQKKILGMHIMVGQPKMPLNNLCGDFGWLKETHLLKSGVEVQLVDYNHTQLLGI